ncbi:fatty acid--CoA ligase family protein [uncultured Abyssibacter sp.]|uniref:class I adenylate-forming enzyme family protein n=1 Tax=uncultured Abyssibacter sp. TaxID=2320202 RepID=UPI0032B1B0ED
MKRLEEMCTAALNASPEQDALAFGEHWYSRGRMRALADRLAALLDAAGAPADAPVAFAPRNHPASVAALIGLLAARRNVQIVYVFQSPAGIARDLRRLAPAVAVVDRRDVGDALLQGMGETGTAVFALGDMDVAPVAGLEHCRAPRGERDDEADERRIEILTSGTTGPPKRFAMSYRAIATYLAGGTAFGTGQDMSALPPGLLFFPLGNISGLYSTLPTVLSGRRAVVLERFSVEAWHAHVKRYRPEACGVPPAGVRMILDADLPPEDLSSLRFLGTGAAPLDPEVQRAFEQRYGVPILLSYGATEFAGPVTAMTPQLHAEWGQHKFGSVGRAMPGARLRVVDPDSGAELPAGEEGVLEVVSPRIGEHWIRTSDIAVLDADGFLFHRGRADGAITRGGFKLLPEVIERALVRHPAVAAAGVVGVADRRLGEVPVAVIELRPGSTRPSVDELEAHLREHVYATHVPVDWRFVEALPRTPLLKVDQRALRALFEQP